MKLYTNRNGGWAGTQADARKAWGKDWIEHEVPTSKQELINFLNINAVGAQHGIANAVVGSTVENVDPTVFNIDQPQRWKIERDADGGAHMVQAPQKAHAWQTIRECAERASIKDLSVALSVYMNRVDELVDRVAQ